MDRTTLEAELHQAMRGGDEVRKRTLRMVLSAVKLAEVEARAPLDEAAMLAVLQKEVKARREAIADAERAGRNDLVNASEAELAVLHSYLPQALSPSDLLETVEQAIREVGASGPQDMGKVMKVVLPRVQGRADGKTVSELVRSQLAQPRS
jgi:hypothetical protein